MKTKNVEQKSCTLNLKWFLRSKYIDFASSFGIGWTIAECLDLHNDAFTPRVICPKGEVGHKIKKKGKIEDEIREMRDIMRNVGTLEFILKLRGMKIGRKTYFSPRTIT